MKLNLGAGQAKLEGYENIDIADGKLAYPLTEYADNSVDEIRASHILEHFPHRDVVKVLQEWVRVLKVNGLMKLAVPDFDYIVNQYKKQTSEPLQAYLMGGQVDANDIHKSAFGYNTLEEAMRLAGLTEIRWWQSDAQDCSSLPVSLNLQGIKRRKMAAVWSMPKLGHTENWRCAASIFPKMEIDLRIGTGVFWEQVLSRMFQDVIAEKYEWFFVLDYDTVFDASHVNTLMKLMEDHPEADAIAPVQIRREGDSPMFIMRDDDGKKIESVEIKTFANALVKVYSAHFGLTLFRASAFRDLVKPWFLAQPDERGEWGEGRQDPDIYFWKNWRACGKSLYLATHVHIGHEQQMITWPGSPMEAWKPLQQYANDYSKEGSPQFVKQWMAEKAL